MYRFIAKKINIYNSEGIIQYSTYGNFEKICEENNLPKNALIDSYKLNKPIPIKNTKRNITALKNKGYGNFIGWYAKIIK